MERGTDEFLIYHPNAAADGHSAVVDGVEWYRAFDGATQRGAPVAGGGELPLQAPWRGQDVVLRLNR